MGESFGYADAAVTPHELSTLAAMEIYACGGNAADAAIAANAVQGVVAPETCGVGGDLFALVLDPRDSAPRALNASGRAGSGVDAATLRSKGFRTIPYDHPYSVTIPGCVDGWAALNARFGSLDLPALLAPAIRYARHGFPISEEFARSLDRRRNQLEAQVPSWFGHHEGDRLLRPDLAATLQAVAEGGREAFYTDRAGRAIVDAVEGAITPEDLDRPQAEWVSPVQLDVFGRTGWTVPPNSQGYLTLAAAWLFAHTNPPTDPDDPEYVHLQIEAYRAVGWERDDLVADPATTPLNPEQLLAPERLGDRLAKISRSRTTAWPAPKPAPGGTAYLAFLDESGMGVSLIQSNFTGFGAGIAARGAGFLLQNRGAGFDLRPGHPNELRPGRRPLHTLSPSLWTRDGRLDTVLGTRGGHYQPQLLLQMAAHLFHAGLSPGEAQYRPRWVLTDTAGPSVIRVEDRTSSAVVQELLRRGHVVGQAESFEPGWGPVSVIRTDDRDLRIGAADPRVGTAKAAVR